MSPITTFGPFRMLCRAQEYTISLEDFYRNPGNAQRVSHEKAAYM